MNNRGDSSRTGTAPSEWVPGGGRLEWVDVARGVGIVAVVVGHVWTRGPLRDAVYSFHMPLFFLLSGLLSRPQAHGAFALRQFGSQMRPYAAFLTLLILADQIVEPLKGHRPIFDQWPQDLLPVLLGGSWLRGPYTIFWFVPCLMVGRILFNMLLTRWPDPLDRRWMLLMLLLLPFAYITGRITDISVLGSLSVPMAIALLWIGCAWQKVGWRRWFWWPLAALSLAGLSGLLPTLNMKAGDYGMPLLSIGSAIATSLLLFRFSVRMGPVGGWLAEIGRASLVIMYLHVAVIHYLAPMLGKSWLMILALALPMGANHLMKCSSVTRRIFL